MTAAARLGTAAALLLVAACGPVAPPVTMPQPPGLVLSDPGRQAINNTAYAFGSQGVLAGRPADAALAIAQAEFLTVDLAVNQRWASFAPRVQQGFAAARAEWRQAVGIAPDAAPQAVIDGLFAARTALLAGDRRAASAALVPPAFVPGGEATLARLAALPPLPLAGRAASDAQGEMWRDQVQIEVE